MDHNPAKEVLLSENWAWDCVATVGWFFVHPNLIQLLSQVGIIISVL